MQPQENPVGKHLDHISAWAAEVVFALYHRRQR